MDNMVTCRDFNPWLRLFLLSFCMVSPSKTASLQRKQPRPPVIAHGQEGIRRSVLRFSGRDGPSGQFVEALGDDRQTAPAGRCR
jgi:hypothetical protein